MAEEEKPKAEEHIKALALIWRLRREKKAEKKAE